MSNICLTFTLLENLIQVFCTKWHSMGKVISIVFNYYLLFINKCLIQAEVLSIKINPISILCLICNALHLVWSVFLLQLYVLVLDKYSVFHSFFTIFKNCSNQPFSSWLAWSFWPLSPWYSSSTEVLRMKTAPLTVSLWRIYFLRLTPLKCVPSALKTLIWWLCPADTNTTILVSLIGSVSTLVAPRVGQHFRPYFSVIILFE